MRNALWSSIANTLETEIGSGHYAPGERLPTEAQLAARFGVNRHTVRRALAHLVGLGLVHTRRGSGAFVAQNPTDYPLGRRVRFHQNMLEAGRTPERQMLRIETRYADANEAEALVLDAGASVHVCEGLSLVDDNPLAVFRSVFPAARFPALPDDLRANPSVTAALKAGGVNDYTRAHTRIDAKLASATLAGQLQVKPGAPILRTTSVNVDTNTMPVEYGRTWFAGDRVTMTLALPA